MSKMHYKLKEIILPNTNPRAMGEYHDRQDRIRYIHELESQLEPSVLQEIRDNLSQQDAPE